MAPTAEGKSTRRWMYEQLDSSAGSGGISPLNALVIALIIVSIFIQIVETEPLVVERFSAALDGSERVLVVAFVVEYVLRLWAAGERPEYAGVRGRIRYALTPFALIDLLAIVPSLLSFGTVNASPLRALRILRILRFARFGALQLVTQVLRNRLPELAVSLGLLSGLILVSATGMYVLEGVNQPETFGSIPRALWWSVITMTTVGYGDVTPQTPLGKLLAGLVALAGVAAVAIPTGILAASFSEVMALKRQRRVATPDEPPQAPSPEPTEGDPS